MIKDILNKNIEKLLSKITVKEVLIRELGPREGFQMEKQFVDTLIKIEFIN
ncbi:MAG: hypothetical protein ACP5RD_08210 [bacterium]|jgi:hypothetical protein